MFQTNADSWVSSIFPFKGVVVISESGKELGIPLEPVWYCCSVAKLCPTLWDPMDGSPPGSTVQRILQARILECVAMPSSKESSWPRDRIYIYLCLLHWQAGSWPLLPPRKPKNTGMGSHFLLQGIFPTQGWNPCFLWLLHWQEDSLPVSHGVSHNVFIFFF